MSSHATDLGLREIFFFFFIILSPNQQRQSAEVKAENCRKKEISVTRQ